MRLFCGPKGFLEAYGNNRSNTCKCGPTNFIVASFDAGQLAGVSGDDWLGAGVGLVLGDYF